MSLIGRTKDEDTMVLGLPNGQYSNAEPMVHGLGTNSAKAHVTACHPLEKSEKNWEDNQYQMNLQMLRNTQGLHAPLRLQMERVTARKIQRLPGLLSSNAMLDTLTGKDTNIEFDDILNNPFDKEVMGDPHALMEKRLGLL